MEFIFKIGDINPFCDKCKILASDEEGKIKESYEKPVNYIKLLDFT